MKICKNCKHVIARDIKLRDLWKCKHPDLTRPAILDPITGQQVFSNYGTLVSEPHPYCCEININGECHYYDASN